MMALWDKVGEFLTGGTAQSVYWACAISGTLLFIISVVLSLFGASSDIADGDMDVNGDVDLPHPDTGFLDLKFISFRTVLAFVTMFGWGGVIFGEHGWIGLVGALLCGTVMMVISAFVIALLMKLQQNGTISNASMVGKFGTVYLSIPGSRSGAGKVNVDAGSATHEIRAFADAPIATGRKVRVVAHLSGSDFLVTEEFASPAGGKTDEKK